MNERRSVAVGVLLMLLAAAPLFSQSIWNGAQMDNDWSQPANWTGGLPGPGTNVTIPTGMPSYPIFSVWNDPLVFPTINNLTIEAGATISVVGRTLTVNGTFSAASSATPGISMTNGTLSVAGTSSIGSNITASGAATVNLSGAATLTNSVTITTVGGPIAFGNTVNGTTGGGAETLTVNAGTGTVTFTGAVGSADATSLTTVTLTNSGTLSFNSTVNLTGDLTQTNAATGATTFGGTVNVNAATLRGTSYSVNNAFTATGAVAVTNSGSFAKTATGTISAASISTTGAANLSANVTTTTGGQTYTGAVTLGANVNFTSPAGQLVWFGNTVAGAALARTLTVTTANARFDGVVSGLIASVSVGGTTAINTATITTTTGGQTYTGAVTLGANVTFTGNLGTQVWFGNTVTGAALARTLTVTTANARFDGVVSGLIASVSVGGTTAINTATITTTTSGQTYTGAVTLGANVNFTSPAAQLVWFGNTVAGAALARTLTVTTANARFDGVVSGLIASVSVGGTTAINTTTITTTTGGQTYTGAVTLGANVNFTGNLGTLVYFVNTVTGAALARTLTVTTANARFDGVVSGLIASVSVGGATAINTATITTTTGGQTYTGAVTLGANVNFTGNLGSLVWFGNTVAGSALARTLTVTTANARFDNTVSGLIASVSVGGTTAINTATITTTTGGQTYTGAVTLGANVNFTSPAAQLLWFANTVTGSVLARTLTVTTANARFDGVVSGLIASVSVGGATAINTATITTTTTQSYTGLVTLGVDATLSGTTPTFSAGVNGAGNDLTLNFSGTTTIDGATFTNIANLLSAAGGTTQLTGTIVTTGNQTYTDAVSLIGDVTCQSAAGMLVWFGNTVAGSGASRTLTVTTANAQFDNTVSGLIASVSVDGTSAINTTTITTTTGGQTYTGAVTLGANVNFTSPAAQLVWFGNTVAGAALARTLTVTTANARFDGVVSGLIASVSVGGATAINTATITTTTGGQTYTGAVTLGANVNFTSPAAQLVWFGNTVAGSALARTLTVTTANAQFDNTVSGLIASVSVGGTTAINTATITTTTGGQTYTGAVTLGANVNFTSPAAQLVWFANTVTGSVLARTLTVTTANARFDGVVSGLIASVSVGGATAINTATITTTTTQSYTGLVTLGVDATLSGTTPTFSAGVNGAGNDLTLNFSGTTTIDGATFTNIANLLSAAGGTTQLTGTIVTTGNQTYTDAVSLIGDVTCQSAAGMLVWFGNTVAGAALARTLTVTTANAQFDGVVSGLIASVSVDGTSAINTTTITTTTGGQTYTGAVTLGANVNFTSPAAQLVWFGNTVAGAVAARTLTVTTANARFDGAVSGLIASVSVGGATAINTATITTTTGGQTYTGAVTLGANVNFTSPAAQLVWFGNTVAGSALARTLTVTTANAQFDNTVSGLIASVSVGGATAINTATITTTTGGQTYTGAVTLGANVSFTGNLGTLVWFGNTVAGSALARTLTVVTANARFDGVVSGLIASVSVDGTTTINTATIATTTTQSYTGLVTLGVAATLSGTTPTFSAGVNGAGNDLTLNFSGTTTIDGATFTNIANLLSAAGGTTQLTGTIVTTGNQTYTDAVSLIGDVTCQSAAGMLVWFGNTVAGAALARTLTVTTANAQFDGVVSGLIASVSVDGATAINTTTITTTTGGQTYTGAVTLGANVNFTSPAAQLVWFGNAVAGSALARTLTVTTANARFDGAVSGLIASVSVGGATAINTATITTTTGGQTYTGAVTLGANVTFTGNLGTLVLFGNTVTGSALARTLTVTTANAQFDNTVSGLIASVSVDGTTVVNTATITTTTGGQTYTGSVTLGANVTFTGNLGTLVLFGNTVAGSALARTLTVTTANARFDGAVSGLIASVSVDGTTAINTTTITTTTGGQTYTGAVTLGADANFTSPAGQLVWFGNTVAGSALARTLTVTTANARFDGVVSGLIASVSVGGTTAINTATIATTTTQSYTGLVTLGVAATLSGTTPTFSAGVNGAGNDLTLNFSGTTTINGATFTNIANLLSAAGGTTQLTGTIVTTGNQTYTDAVSLIGDVTCQSAAGMLVWFGNTVAGSGASRTLTVTTANAQFDGVVSGLIASVSVDGATAINTTTITTTTGGQTYTGAVTLGANVNLTSPAAQLVWFGNTVTGSALARTLTVTTANARFDGAVSGLIASVSVGGATAINTATITTTTGGQTYTGAVTLGANVTFSSPAAQLVWFGNTVAGSALSRTLTVTTANARFDGVVSGLIASVSVGGATAINTATITTTTGGQTYTGAVTLGANVNFTGNLGTQVWFGSTVAGAALARTLTVTTANARFDGVVSGLIASVSVGGTTAINTATIATTTTQSYTGLVTLGVAATLSGTTPTFSAGVNGAGNDLTLNFSGTTTINGATFTNIANLLSAAGGTTQLTGTIVTTGNQTYTDAVSLIGDVTCQSAAGMLVWFGNTVAGSALARTLTVTTANAQFDNTVSGLIASVSVDGTTAINTATITTTTGGQTYTGAVTLGANVNFTSPAAQLVWFGNTVTGSALARTLTVTTANARFDGAVSGLIASVSVGGATAINTATITTTTGGQTYTGAVTLGANVNFTSPAAQLVWFGNTVAGSALARTLTVTTANARFDGVVSGLIASVSVGGTTAINTATITTTTGGQTYTGAVTLGADVNFTSPAAQLVWFGNTVAGSALARTLTVTTANARFDNTVSGLIASVSVDGTTAINTGTITTTTTQSYMGLVTLGVDATLSGTTPTFSAGVNGAGNDLTLSFSGTTTIDGANFTNIANLLSAAAGTTQLTGTIVTTGNQTYTDPLQVIANSTLNAGAAVISLGNTATIDDGVTFSLGAGGPTPISTQAISGTGGGSASNVTFNTTLTATVGGTIDIDIDVTISAGTVVIGSNDFTIGTLVNNGVFQLDGTQFTQAIATPDTDSGTVTYAGAANGIIRITDFFNLRLNGAGRTYTLNQPITVGDPVNVAGGGQLQISAGILDVSGANHQIDLYGNWRNEVGAAGFLPQQGTVMFLKPTTTISVYGDNNWFVFHCTIAGITIEFEDGTTQTIAPIAGSRFRIKGIAPDPTTILEPGPWANSVMLYSINRINGSFWNFTAQTSDSLSEFEYVVLNWSQATPYSITVPQFVLTRFAAQCPGWRHDLLVQATHTEDTDSNGKIDRIFVSIGGTLLEYNFSGFVVSVSSYTVSGFAAGGVGQFYILLEEGLVLDTGVTPAWSILSNSTLRDNVSKQYYVALLGPSETPTDQAPPIIGYTLAMANRDRLFVHVSEPVVNGGGGALVVGDFRYPGATPATAILSQPTPQEYELQLAANVLPVDIAAGSLVTIQNAPRDPAGNNIVSATHRVTDIGLGMVGDGILEPVFGFDGVFSIYQFDGSRWLRDKDITLEAHVHNDVLSNPTTRLWFDVNAPAASRSTAGLWLPPFDGAKFNGLVPVSVSSFPRLALNDMNGNANISDFTIPSSDVEMVDAAVVEVILEVAQPDPLYCATSPDVTVANWFRDVVPWSFDIHDERTQKAGVSILSNVINPDLGEVTTLHYVVGSTGTVTIGVYDLAGDLVRFLARNSNVAPGDYLQTWDGRNASGRVVSRGVYFIRIVGPGIDEVRKVLVTR